VTSEMYLIAQTPEGREAYQVLDSVNNGLIDAGDGVGHINEIYGRTEPDTPAAREVMDAGGIVNRLASVTIAPDSIIGQAGL